MASREIQSPMLGNKYNIVRVGAKSARKLVSIVRELTIFGLDIPTWKVEIPSLKWLLKSENRQKSYGESPTV